MTPVSRSLWSTASGWPRIMRPGKRQRPSEEQKARLVASGAEFPFLARARSDSDARFCDGESSPVDCVQGLDGQEAAKPPLGYPDT